MGAFRPGQHGLAARYGHAPAPNGTATLAGSMSSAPSDPLIAPRLSSHAEPSGYGPISSGKYQGRVGEVYVGTNHTTYGASPFPANNSHTNGSFAPPHYASPPLETSGVGYMNGVKQESFSNGEINTNTVPTFLQPYSGEVDSAIEMSPPHLPNGWSHGSSSSGLPTAEFPLPLESPSFITNNSNYHIDTKPAVHELEYAQRKPSMSSHVDPRPTGPELIDKGIASHHQGYVPPPHTPWAVEPEEEYFDVDSEDDGYDTKPQLPDSSSYNLGPLIAMSASHSNSGIRSMHNFLDEPNVLATYVPSYAASPLMDPQTARVFCHFITATAPTLQVCERHPSNPSVIFSGVPVPKSQRALWSYTMPMLALTHQGLLHAMLALGSLHIAKLQQTSPTPSLKHYHYALRRVAKALGNSKKRKNVATLAATLLLGFYEITTAEHNKWNSHLSGARELVMDIDFAGMSKKIESHRRRQEQAEAEHNISLRNGRSNHFYDFDHPRASGSFPSKHERRLDENLISTIMGRQLKYNQYGQVFDEYNPPSHNETPPTPNEIDVYEIQSDLFWWYAKQDMYQGLVSGNRLL